MARIQWNQVAIFCQSFLLFVDYRHTLANKTEIELVLSSAVKTQNETEAIINRNEPTEDILMTLCHPNNATLTADQDFVHEMENEEVTLHCRTSCEDIPELDTPIQWMLPSGDIWQEWNNSEIDVNLTAGTLYIESLQRKHGGVYTCFLTNMGNSTGTTTLKVLWIPSYYYEFFLMMIIISGLVIVAMMLAVYVYLQNHKVYKSLDLL